MVITSETVTLLSIKGGVLRIAFVTVVLSVGEVRKTPPYFVVFNYMKMPNIEEKIDQDLIIKVLNEIKQIIPLSDSMNVSKMLKRYRELVKTVKPNILNNIAIAERDVVNLLQIS